MKLLPSEVYSFSGPDIAAKLKSRRDILHKIAADYFKVLAENVEVTGSGKSDHFVIDRLSDTTTLVTIFKFTKEDKASKPFYSRIFDNRQTTEIRLYGLNGEDKYTVRGKVNKGVQIRLIGGPSKDIFVDSSQVRSLRKATSIHDNKQNAFTKSSETKLQLSSDTGVHSFKWDGQLKYDRKYIKPIVFYNNEDRIYAGLAFTSKKYSWRKDPIASIQYFDVKYSIPQNALSTTYESVFTELIGKWNLVSHVNYDAVRWTNFFGLGNNTIRITDDRDYYRMRSREFFATAGLERIIRKKHLISFMPHFQMVDVINDTARFVSKTLGGAEPKGLFEMQRYAGAGIRYVFQATNNLFLPTKGIGFSLAAEYTANLKDRSKSFGRYASEVKIYVPVSRKLGFTFKGGGSTMTGTPDFYQYNRIGGSRTLRGHQRDRYYGTSTFYNQNELRWITDARTFLFNGKFGIFGLYDIGRVWIENEKSDIWHASVGGGVIVSVFNKITFAGSYAISKDDRQVNMIILKPF
jgi:hypothetical protein